MAGDKHWQSVGVGAPCSRMEVGEGWGGEGARGQEGAGCTTHCHPGNLWTGDAHRSGFVFGRRSIDGVEQIGAKCALGTTGDNLPTFSPSSPRHPHPLPAPPGSGRLLGGLYSRGAAGPGCPRQGEHPVAPLTFVFMDIASDSSPACPSSMSS